MKFDRYFFLPLVGALLWTAPLLRAQQGQPGKQQTPALTQPAAAAAPKSPIQGGSAPIVTEDSLRKRLVGKMVFLRGCYMGENLEFDENGKVNGSPAKASFTLSALEISKVHLSKHKLEIEGNRYALHFFGALPYENDTKTFDRVKISKKPVHISIERELVAIPKEKKKKAGKNAANSGIKLAAAHPAATALAKPEPAAMAPGTTSSPAHSAMLLNHALDNIFASKIDQRMLAAMPAYWQRYFKSQREHREFMPADTSILAVGDGIVPPKILNSIDPSSNQYAQKYGIAGLTLFRAVIDASGKPEEIAIARPIGFGLDENAVRAIQASRFIPASKNGHPIPVIIDIVVTFRIYSNRTKPGSVPKGAKRTEVAVSSWDEDALQPSKSH